MKKREHILREQITDTHKEGSDETVSLNEVAASLYKEAIHYEYGIKPKNKNLSLAHAYFNVAAHLGHKNARESRERISQFMSKEEIVQAQYFARNFEIDSYTKNYKENSEKVNCR